MNDTIFLIIAPSGAGKTTITERLEALYGLKSIQSYTTRPPRYEGETGHTFVSDEEFDNLTDIVAYTEFCGNRYCATSEQVDTHDLYVIDPKGVEFFKNAYHGDKQVRTIYIKSGMSVRYERMKSRYENSGMTFSEATDETLTRIKNDNNEFREYELFGIADFTVRNEESDIIDDVVDKVYNYIVSVREGV